MPFSPNLVPQGSVHGQAACGFFIKLRENAGRPGCAVCAGRAGQERNFTMQEASIHTLEFNQILDKLCSYAHTDTAREKLRSLRPFLEERRVLAGLRETDDARLMIDALGSPPLTAMKEIRAMLLIAEKGGMLLPEQFGGLQQFIASCRRLKAYLKKGEATGAQAAQMGNSLDSLDFLYDEINQAIRNNLVDSEASRELRDLRRKMEHIGTRIKSQLDDMLRKKREYFSDSFVSIRGGHYTLPVKREYKHQVSGTVVDLSATGATCFIEPTAVLRLRDELSALKAAESVEETRILYTLTGLVEDCRTQILWNMEAMDTLDFLFAKGRLSAELDAVRPQINTRRELRIVRGRHPLLNSADCVPLDFQAGNGVQGVLITGPNTGGKTVALKTIGLFSLMAQCGLHLPCQEADICLNSSVLCDIGDNQSIAENLSTFSAHITNIIRILENTGKESLVLLDELGSGTDPAEGMGLAIAILEELRTRGCLFVATTHYPEVKEYAEETEGLVNARMTFDRETLRPLYRLEIGEAGESCALYIASRLGLPGQMLERAHREAYRERTGRPYPAKPEELPFAAATGQDLPLPVKPSAPQIVPRKEMPSIPAHALKFQVGDTVVVYPKKQIGIVFRTANGRGEIGVQIQKEKQFISHKRLQVKTSADQLYPENYDFSIVFDSVETRKARRKMEKGHQPGMEIQLDEPGKKWP